MYVDEIIPGCYYRDYTSDNRSSLNGTYYILSVNNRQVECKYQKCGCIQWNWKSFMFRDGSCFEKINIGLWPDNMLCPDDPKFTQNVAKTKETKMNTTKVTVHLYSQSQPITIESVVNTYQKGDLFCVSTGGKVCKFPLVHIFRITEEQQ